MDITGQYSSESRVEFGVVKSTGKQGRRENGKYKKRKELQSAVAGHYNPFANADPLLPR